MKQLIDRAIRLSAVAQFASGKVSLVLSTVTAATVLSMKFHVSLLLTFGIVAACGIALVVVVVKSGWYNRELDYIGKKMVKQ